MANGRSQIAFASVFEILGQALSETIFLEQVAALTSIVQNALASAELERSSLKAVGCKHSVLVTAFEDGKDLLQLVLLVISELNRLNLTRVGRAHIAVRVGLDLYHSASLLTRESVPEHESLVLAAAVGAQEVASFGVEGHILISNDYYQEVIVRSEWARYIVYFGRYRRLYAPEMGIWALHDPVQGIGNHEFPVENRVEDERGIDAYVPPYLKLKKPRPLSPDKAAEIATEQVKVLALSPHPNDIPWGCAGTLLWLKEMFDARIYLHFLTSTRAPHVTGEAHYGPPSRGLGPALWSFSILTAGEPLSVLQEVRGLAEDDAIHKILSKIPRLGRTPHQAYIEGHILDPVMDKPPLPPEGMFLDGYMDRYPSVVRDRLAWIQSQIQPDIVLCPSLKDTHQDHRVTAEAVMTVFKFQESIWYYELPQASRNPFYHFSPNLFVDISGFAERKMSLLSTCFEYDSKRFHFSAEGAQALMRSRAIEGYYERVTLPGKADPIAPGVEAFEARMYF